MPHIPLGVPLGGEAGQGLLRALLAEAAHMCCLTALSTELPSGVELLACHSMRTVHIPLSSSMVVVAFRLRCLPTGADVVTQLRQMRELTGVRRLQVGHILAVYRTLYRTVYSTGYHNSSVLHSVKQHTAWCTARM